MSTATAPAPWVVVSKNDRRQLALVAVGIFVLAMVVRLVFVHFFSRAPVNDLWWNDQVGWNLATWHGYSASLGPPYVPGIFRSPGYPLFLALIYKIVGHYWHAVFVVQALVDSFTALLVWRIAYRLLGLRVGIFAGVLYGVYPYPAMFCGILEQDILLTFTVTLTLYFVVRAQEEPERRLFWLLAGLALGAAALVKPFLVLYCAVPVVAALRCVIPWKRRLTNLAMVAVLSAAVFLPWLVRNYEVFHIFPLPAAGGTGSGLVVTLEEAEHGEAGFLAKIAGAASRTSISREQYLATFVDGQALVHQEAALSRQALPGLVVHWRAYLRLMVRHVFRLWLTVFAGGSARYVTFAGAAISIAFLVFGVLGMFCARSSLRLLAPVYATVAVVTLIYVPYNIEARYTLPARPAMTVFVAMAMLAPWSPCACLLVDGEEHR